MKRIAASVLAVLLLSGCVSTGAPAPPPVESPPEASSLVPFRLDEQYTRYYAETTLGLIPRTDYGEIYPYLGGLSASYWGGNFAYGLCTADGAIVCDPCYRDVALYEYEGERVYVLYKTTGRVGDWDGQENTATLAACDGSFVLEFDDIKDGGEGTLAVQKGGRWGSVDYRGKELLPCVYQHVMPFSDGLALVTMDFETEYRYADKQNRTVIGPLPPLAEAVVSGLQGAYNEEWHAFDRLAFHEGRVKYFEGVKHGYMDKTGAVVIPVQYSNGWSGTFENGRTVVNGENLNWSALIDLDGNEIVPMRECDLYRVGTGDTGVYELYDREQQRQWYIDRDGNEIAEILYIGNSMTYYYLGGGWYTQSLDGETTLWRDGITYPVGNPFHITWLGGDRFGANYYCADGSQTAKIIDSAGTVYFTAEDGESFNVSLTADRVQLYANGLYGVMDLDGNVLVPPLYTSLRPIGDHYLIRQGFYGGLLNQAGDWVIKVSLLDSLMD